MKKQLSTPKELPQCYLCKFRSECDGHNLHCANKNSGSYGREVSFTYYCPEFKPSRKS